MDLKKYKLFINGKIHRNRGLDLALNPYNGQVVGKVMLVSESLLTPEKPPHEEETDPLITAETTRKFSS